MAEPPPNHKSDSPSSVSYVLSRTLTGHSKPVSAVRFSPNGKLIASASADKTIILWDALTGQKMHVLEGHLAGISALSWAPNSRHLASGSDDKSIRLWDTLTGLPHPTPFLGHHNYVFSLAFSPKGNMLVSGSYDEAVFLWDVRSGSVMKSLPAHSDPVGGVDFVYDGTLVVSCSSDGLIRLWDSLTGQCLRTIVHESNSPVTSVRFSPNGQFIVAWTLDSSIRLWDYVKGKCLKTYQGHSNQKFSITGTFGVYGHKEPSTRPREMAGPDEDRMSVDGACAHEADKPTDKTDGRGGRQLPLLATANKTFPLPRSFIASGDESGSIYIWDVDSKRELQKMPDAHKGTVFSVDSHPSKCMLASAGADGLVKIWTEASTL